jgi:hypothetical protein
VNGKTEAVDTITVRELTDSLTRVLAWVRKHDYKGFEPADGNLSFLFPLTAGRVWPMRIVQQVVLRSPFNVRPWLGVQPHESAIGRCYIGWAHLMMAQRDTAATAANRAEAVSCLEWLIQHPAGGFTEFCWGDPYEYATRGGRRPFGAPILIWTSLIGLLFLDAYDTLADERYLRVAESVGRWVASIPRERTDSGTCLSYNAYSQASIHNSNAMGGAFLARLGRRTNNESAITLAREAMKYTCTRQRSDGSWWYGEGSKYHWIDNFHTGYNLSALKVYRAALDDVSFDFQLSRGHEYYKTHFFDPKGRPKYYHDRTYPIDIQCAAQSIETLTAMADDDPASWQLALRVAAWTVRNMQARDGHFQYRDLGWTAVTTPMLHWGQGTMAKALAGLVKGEAIRHQTPSDPAYAGVDGR